jgi:predicted Zn-dependent protease
MSIARKCRRTGDARPPKGAAFYRGAAVWARLGLASALMGLSAGCATLSNFNLLSVEQDAELGQNAFTEVQETAVQITSGPEYEMVQRVTKRLVEAARHFQPKIVGEFEWEAILIDDPKTVNAWCLPGGKMAVYTGILPVTETEAGLAVVMGHEISHATARHGTEALTRSQGLDFALAMIGETAAGTSLAGNEEILAVGTNLLLQLPMGRGAELEADREGLKVMARAGYDPREAVDFWGRMSSLGGKEPSEWLSTHPSHGSRIDQLEHMMPEASEIYYASLARVGDSSP